MKAGRIMEVGTYAELMKREGAFAEYVHNYGTSEGNQEDDPSKLCKLHVQLNVQHNYKSFKKLIYGYILYFIILWSVMNIV